MKLGTEPTTGAIKCGEGPENNGIALITLTRQARKIEPEIERIPRRLLLPIDPGSKGRYDGRGWGRLGWSLLTSTPTVRLRSVGGNLWRQSIVHATEPTTARCPAHDKVRELTVNEGG
ncbi:MAG: hypothetical protein KJZ87_02340 [Thermoguttaceae bacterium]|nr:hypothetical protein [Thermoguttaceae bacterium]